MKYLATVGELEFQVEIVDDHHVLLNGRLFQVDFDSLYDQPVFSLLLDGHSYEAFVYPAGNDWQVLLMGRSFQFLIEDEKQKRLREASGGGPGDRSEFLLKAPMPGLVISVPVGEGQEVRKGEVLLVLESMKMQNELKSPCDGTINRLRVKSGDRIEQNQTLLSVV